MATPNLISPSVVNGKTNKIEFTVSGQYLLVGNSTGSGKILKINSLAVYLGEEYKVNGASIYIKDADDNTFVYDDLNKYSYARQPTASQITPLTMPNQSTRWKVISKDEMIYLNEGDQIYLGISFISYTYTGYAIVSYEEIS